MESSSDKGGHDVHLSKNRDSLGDKYGLSGRHGARLMRDNQTIPEIKELLDKGEMYLTAAVQLSYLPEQGQKLALNASEKYGIKITEGMAVKVRKGSMTEKIITGAIAGVQPELDPLGLPVEEKLVFKPAK